VYKILLKLIRANADDFVTFLNSYRVQREMERRGPGIERDRMLAAYVFGEVCFEALNFLTGRKPPRLESLDHRLDLIVPDLGNVEGHKFRFH